MPVSEEKQAESYNRLYLQKKVCCATCNTGYYANLVRNPGDTNYRCPNQGCLRARSSEGRDFKNGWTRGHFYDYVDWEPFHYIEILMDEDDFDI